MIDRPWCLCSYWWWISVCPYRMFENYPDVVFTCFKDFFHDLNIYSHPGLDRMWHFRKNETIFEKTHLYICIYVYMYICIYVSMYLCIYVYMYLCIYVYMYICIYVYMYISIDMYIYIYIYLVGAFPWWFSSGLPDSGWVSLDSPLELDDLAKIQKKWVWSGPLF